MEEHDEIIEGEGAGFSQQQSLQFLPVDSAMVHSRSAE